MQPVYCLGICGSKNRLTCVPNPGGGGIVYNSGVQRGMTRIKVRRFLTMRLYNV
jgi:hypothetical protein